MILQLDLVVQSLKTLNSGDFETFGLVAMLTAERLVRGIITPSDAAIAIVTATQAARDAARCGLVELAVPRG